MDRCVSQNNEHSKKINQSEGIANKFKFTKLDKETISENAFDEITRRPYLVQGAYALPEKVFSTVVFVKPSTRKQETWMNLDELTDATGK